MAHRRRDEFGLSILRPTVPHLLSASFPLPGYASFEASVADLLARLNRVTLDDEERSPTGAINRIGTDRLP